MNPKQEGLSFAVATFVAVVLLVLLSCAARADCVWVPLCLPPHDPPYEAMRLYLSDQLSHEYRPMWGVHRTEWSRVNIWACGEARARMTLSMVVGEQESDRLQMKVAPGSEDAPCPPPNAAVPEQFPTLGSHYGPIEQLLRAVNRNQARDPRPVDTDRDGVIRPNDAELLRRVARRQFSDSTTLICVEDACP